MNVSDYFYECDGPPTAYFELLHPATKHAYTQSASIFRGVYEALYIHAANEQSAREKFDELLRIAYQPNVPPDNDGRTQFLVWRVRPTWDDMTRCLRARLWISNFTFGSLMPPDEADRYIWTMP